MIYTTPRLYKSRPLEAHIYITYPVSCVIYICASSGRGICYVSLPAIFFRKILPTGSTIPPSNVKKTVSVGSPGPARLTAVTFAENGTKAPGGFKKLQSIQETNRNQQESA